VARAIIELARSLELDVVAEGIETEEQRAALLALGCHSGQGFLFGMPMPVDDAVEWLNRQAARRDGGSARGG
jgi:EAL domain-containing protein (putative c-di-GMP-specific phosphodiesterase class I)